MFRKPSTLNEKNLCLAISFRKLVSLTYDGGMRKAMPVAIGLSGKGHALLRCWQLAGYSLSGGVPDWRLLSVEKINNLQILQETFMETDLPAGYNSLGDSALAHIWEKI